MLAYLFWHQSRPGVDRAEYEQAQRTFHAALNTQSACFRLDHLPFDAAGATDEPAYEDWYLLDDWNALGHLNAAAVDADHRPQHDAAAALSGPGWGAVYALIRGPATIPAAVRWTDKPRGAAIDDALGDVTPGSPAWQRQLVLGPAPELCLGGLGPPRTRVWPTDDPSR